MPKVLIETENLFRSYNKMQELIKETEKDIYGLTFRATKDLGMERVTNSNISNVVENVAFTRFSIEEAETICTILQSAITITASKIGFRKRRDMEESLRMHLLDGMPIQYLPIIPESRDTKTFRAYKRSALQQAAIRLLAEGYIDADEDDASEE